MSAVEDMRPMTSPSASGTVSLMPNVTICIDVPDLGRATAFYCEGLGCSLVKKRDSHNTVSANGAKIHLALKEAGTPATGQEGPVRDYARHWTPIHLDFDVEDIQTAIAAVKRLGGTVEDTKRGDWGAAAFCADPFGNGFCLLALK